MHREYSIINLIYAYVGQICGIIINFIARIVFVRCLDGEYLGINSLFANIITLLSFAELGIGAAMVFSLYEPLAKNDTEKIKSLMYLYKKYYRIIGCTVLILGLCLTPFLQFFIKEMPDISGLRIYYMLFVLNSAISYFYNYKRSLIICDQKRYIATFYRYLFYCLVNLAQIFLLLVTRNYLLYLICQVIFTFLENVAISHKADMLYPYIKEKKINKLDDASSQKLSRDIKATFLNRIGVTIIRATDSIVISKFLGVIEVGIYSNYMMIITALNTITYQVFNSITASIGNIGVTHNAQDLKKIFDKVNFLAFFIFGIVCVCLVNVMNPFVELWLGKEYVLKTSVSITIIVSFFITGMREVIVTYKDAMGLYHQDKYRPIITCTVNVIVSIILVNKIGLIGVVLGTIISNIGVDLAVEPYYLYKYTLKANVLDYYKKYIQYSFVTILIAIVVHFVLGYITINSLIISFIVKGVLSFSISAVIMIAIYFRTEEFKYCMNTMKVAINMIKNKLKIGEK